MIIRPIKRDLTEKSEVVKAIILIHEIYGKNHFIDAQCNKFRSLGFDVYCPDLLDENVFSYGEQNDAYAYFYENVGLNAYHQIWELLDKIKCRYEKIYMIGYSVGAALAWRCSENPNCSGVVACYGSRIRDFADVRPRCPVFLVFAEEDSFDVHSVKNKLEGLENVRVSLFRAKHGFLDFDSAHYDAVQAEAAEKKIVDFIDGSP